MVEHHWHNVHTKFHQNLSSGSQVGSCGQTDRQMVRYTDTGNPISVHFVQRPHNNEGELNCVLYELRMF
jgi:hypothetical protein